VDSVDIGQVRNASALVLILASWQNEAPKLVPQELVLQLAKCPEVQIYLVLGFFPTICYEKQYAVLM